MKVPVTPQTRVAQVKPNYQRAAQNGGDGIGQGLATIGRALALHRERVEKEQGVLDAFDLNTAMLEESNNLKTIFDTRKEEAPLGANNFAESINSEFETRHRDMLAQYKAEGYQDEQLRDLSLQLGQQRGAYVSSALVFQEGRRKAAVAPALDRLELAASQHAAANPDSINSVLTELEHGINLRPELDAAEKVEEFEQRKARIVGPAGMAFAMNNPKVVLEKLAPQFLVEPSATALKTSSMPAAAGTFSLDNYISKMAPVEGTGKNPKSSAFGHFQFVDKTWNAYYDRVFPGNALTPAQKLAKREDKTIATKLVTEFTNDNIAALDAAGIQSNNTSVYLSHFLGSADALKVLQADLEVPVKDLVSAASVKANPSVFKPGMEVKELLRWAAGKMDDKPVLGWLETGVVPGKEIAAQEAPIENPVAVDGVVGAPQVKTGIDALDYLNGQQRLQVINMARDALRQNNSEAKAAASVLHENRTAALAVGQDPGPGMSDEEGVKLFGETGWGQMKGEEGAATAAGNFMGGMVTESETGMRASLEALRPKDPNSTTFKIDQQNWEAMNRAANANIELRKKDPAAYVFSAFPAVREKLSSADTTQERKAAYALMEEAYNTLGIPERNRQYATKEGLAQIGMQYKSVGPQQKLSMLENYLAELGTKAGRTLAGANDVAKDFALYATLRTLPNYQQTFMRVLDGRDTIEKDPARKPNPAVMNTAFYDGIGPAINNLGGDYSRMINEAAAALFVANNYRVDGGEADADEYAKGLREVLGGRANDEETGVVDLSEGKVKDWTILPPGVNLTQFENWRDKLAPGDLTKLSVDGGRPVDAAGNVIELKNIVDNGVFVMRAPGIYGIKSAIDGLPVLSSKGSPFLFRLDAGRMR